MPDLTTILGLSAVALLGYLLLFTLRVKLDPREPPLVASTIPLVGHLISFLVHGIGYFAAESRKYALPIFTMNILKERVYIITSPDLLPSVRHSRSTMSFDPLFTAMAERAGGIRKPGLQLLREEERGGKGLAKKTVDVMRPALLGNKLDHLNEQMIHVLKPIVDQVASIPTRSLDLYEWCSEALTVASTDAIYGPLNPYKSEAIRRAFWDFESNLSLLLVDTLPWLTCRKAWKGREQLVQAFIQFYQTDGHLSASDLVYARWKVQQEAGATLEDIARLEILTGVGILSNTVPSCFWLLFDILSRPELLRTIQDEIQQNAVSIDSTGTHTLDLADIRGKCPTLLSSFQETLRTRSNSGQLRVIYQDTLLNDHWLLKSGSILLIPAPAINTNSSAWGLDSGTFDPQRFTKTAQMTDKKLKASGFLSFGLSPHICPGRHFATGEILALAALLIVRYDISPMHGSWTEPKPNARAVAASLPPAAEKVEVTAVEREKYKGVEWQTTVTPGKGTYGLIIG
ncbi:putative cytochrome P450 oxidoreductase [Aspergillus bombycis]|uniref:Putative cytochrome P450 oxidoreductase n=1 Tax=Aspergillus bombycis TaxID=109264 RepID=A0A1F8AAA9_9EURO|nr:putative cytochrome P450 oxidoreductase [Aspergillus bombycis]OGM48315.1 putative cytochrome P450 oxidoreductase [Aspergillus bombycis]